MKKFLAMSIILAAVGFAHLKAQSQSAGYGWLSDYQQARAQARTSGKPLMVVFRCVP